MTGDKVPVAYSFTEQCLEEMRLRMELKYWEQRIEEQCLEEMRLRMELGYWAQKMEEQYQEKVQLQIEHELLKIHFKEKPDIVIPHQVQMAPQQLNLQEQCFEEMRLSMELGYWEQKIEEQCLKEMRLSMELGYWEPKIEEKPDTVIPHQVQIAPQQLNLQEQCFEEMRLSMELGYWEQKIEEQSLENMRLKKKYDVLENQVKGQYLENVRLNREHDVLENQLEGLQYVYADLNNVTEYSVTLIWNAKKDVSPELKIVYEIQQSEKSTCKWVNSRFVAGNRTVFTVHNLESNTLYEFRVRSIGLGGSSDWICIDQPLKTNSVHQTYLSGVNRDHLEDYDRTGRSTRKIRCYEKQEPNIQEKQKAGYFATGTSAKPYSLNHGVDADVLPSATWPPMNYRLQKTHILTKMKIKEPNTKKKIQQRKSMTDYTSRTFGALRGLGAYLVPYLLTVKLLCQPALTLAKPGGYNYGYHSIPTCKPSLLDSTQGEVNFRQFECEISACGKVSKLIFEKSGVQSTTEWTTVFQGVNNTNFQVLVTGNAYTLENRTDYHAFPTKHLLYVDPLQLEDEGMWRCVVYDSMNRKFTSGPIKVITYKSAKVSYPEEEIIIETDFKSTFTLHCRGTGHNPSISWRRHGEDIPENDERFIMKNFCTTLHCEGSITSKPVDKTLERANTDGYAGIYTCVISLDYPLRDSSVSPAMIIIKMHNQMLQDTFLEILVGCTLLAMAVVVLLAGVLLLLNKKRCARKATKTEGATPALLAISD